MAKRPALTSLCLLVLTANNLVDAQNTFEWHLSHLRQITQQAEKYTKSAQIVAQQLQDLSLSQSEVLRAVQNAALKLQQRHDNERFSNLQDQDFPDVAREDLGKASLSFVSENGHHDEIGPPKNFPYCYEDTTAFIRHALNMTPWALQMLDATGRPGPGLMTGRFMFVGDYDECVSIQANYILSNGVKTREFHGRYCGGAFTINLDNVPPATITTWGFCLPDSCSSEDALVLVNTTLNELNITELTFSKMECHHPLELEPRAIGVICLVGLFVTLVILGTTLDIVLVQRPKWRIEAINRLSEEEEDQIRNDLGDAPPRWAHEDSLRLLVDIKPPVAEYRPSVPVSLLLAFSAWTNTQKLLNTHQPTGTLKCVNGIRVISISWIILGHCVILMSIVTENLASFGLTHAERWTFQILQNASFSVDTFFVLSGLLVGYLTLKEMKLKNGKINWAMFYVHRYIRLTPIYMMCMAIFAATMPYWSDGPLYMQQGYELNYCEDSWWGNVLYIQNLVKFTQYCMGWSWYLAVDMQFYVVSPLIFVPLYYKPVLGFISAGIFFLGTTITPYVLTLTRYYGPYIIGGGGVKDHQPLGNEDYDLYTAPYCRMGPYLAGLMLGYVLYRINGRRLKLHWAINLLGWASATALALAILYGLFEYAKGGTIELQLSAFYNAFSRTAWGLSVAWVIFSCVTGNGGVIDSFLSWSAWVPLSRLTYAAYLTHPIIQGVWAMTRRTPFFISDVNLVMVYLASLMATYAVSFVASLTFEAPVLGIEKVVFKKEKRS